MNEEITKLAYAAMVQTSIMFLDIDQIERLVELSTELLNEKASRDTIKVVGL